MERTNWQIMHSGEQWSIFKAPGRWPSMRYTVTTPQGSPIAVRATLWGAKRALRRMRDQGNSGSLKWWDHPIVYREPR